MKCFSQLHGWDQTMIYDWWHHITEESKTVENSTCPFIRNKAKHWTIYLNSTNRISQLIKFLPFKITSPYRWFIIGLPEIKGRKLKNKCMISSAKVKGLQSLWNHFSIFIQNRGSNSRYPFSSSRGKEKETRKMLPLKVVGFHCSGRIWSFLLLLHIPSSKYCISSCKDD